MNIKKWKHYLSNYWDQQFCDLLTYEFPLDFGRNCLLYSVEANHTNEHMSHISKFLEEELKHNAILGPFEDKPIEMHTSPLLVRDKQNSNGKRTIRNQRTKAASVNNGVAKYVYLGIPYELNAKSWSFSPNVYD